MKTAGISPAQYARLNQRDGQEPTWSLIQVIVVLPPVEVRLLCAMMHRFCQFECVHFF